MSEVDRMIEDMAKGVCNLDTEGWMRIPRNARLTIAANAADALRSLGFSLETLAALRDGTWKAVPVEPTEAMQIAGNETPISNWYRHADCPEHGQEYIPHCEDCNDAPLLNTLIDKSAVDVFSAMLAAAPSKPEDAK